MSSHRPPPTNPHWKVRGRNSAGHGKGTGDGPAGKHVDSDAPVPYEVSFYPGFASAIHVNKHVLHKEREAFVLPSGSEQPWTYSAVTIKNTEEDFTVTLHIDDPQHRVHRICVELMHPDAKKKLKAEGQRVVAHSNGDPKDEIIIENTPTLCPPDCPP
ncbi:MAG TPA: hypothetical protein VF541_17405 [Longimicrobium sp.]|jgi:hypothetical protein